MRTKLSVNINKVALIRNARGEDLPDLVQFAIDCEAFGAEGITVHPRPDQRHIRYDDIPKLKKVVKTELNIEGYPTPEFMKLVMDNVPDQCTLVPDPPGALTSSEGWDTEEHMLFLQDIIAELHSKHIRTSIFLDPKPKLLASAKKTGTDRIELYTGHYARQFQNDPEAAAKDHIATAKEAINFHLGLNAGHDLNLQNLKYYAEQVPNLLEVSIGHALVTDALYYGIQNTIQMYKRKLG